MTDAACRWAEAEGLQQYLLEYRTPWGICDIVGIELDREKLGARALSGQVGPLGPLRRIAVFEALSSGGSQGMGIAEIVELTGSSMGTVSRDLGILKARKFVVECEPGKFIRQAPWAPLHRRIVAIELKVQSIGEVISQAIANLSFATESYVGLPLETATRLNQGSRRLSLVDAGLGLLGIRHHDAEVLLKPSVSPGSNFDRVLQTHCTEQSARRLVEIYRQTSISA